VISNAVRGTWLGAGTHPRVGLPITRGRNRYWVAHADEFWALRFEPAARLPSNRVSWPVHAVAPQRRWLPVPGDPASRVRLVSLHRSSRRAALNLDPAVLLEASGIPVALDQPAFARAFGL